MARGVETIDFSSLLAVLRVVAVSVPLERQQQLRHGHTGIGVGLFRGTRSTICERIDRDSGYELSNEFAISDSAFIATVGSEKEISAVDSDASLAARFVKQVRREDVLFSGHVRFLHFISWKSSTIETGFFTALTNVVR